MSRSDDCLPRAGAENDSVREGGGSLPKGAPRLWFFFLSDPRDSCCDDSLPLLLVSPFTAFGFSSQMGSPEDPWSEAAAPYAMEGSLPKRTHMPFLSSL